MVLCFSNTYTYLEHPWTDFNSCLMEPLLYIFLWHSSYVTQKDVLVRDWFFWSDDAHWNPGEYAEIQKSLFKKKGLFCLQYATIMLLFSTKEFQRGPNWKLLCTKSVFKSNGFNSENEIWIFFFKGHITRTYFCDSKGNHIKIKCIWLNSKILTDKHSDH